jgi:hypothetical protein
MQQAWIAEQRPFYQLVCICEHCVGLLWDDQVVDVCCCWLQAALGVLDQLLAGEATTHMDLGTSFPCLQLVDALQPASTGALA